MAGAVTDSGSEDETKEEAEEWTAVCPRNKGNPESVPALQTTENKCNRKLPRGASEEVGYLLLYQPFLQNSSLDVFIFKIKLIFCSYCKISQQCTTW